MGLWLLFLELTDSTLAISCSSFNDYLYSLVVINRDLDNQATNQAKLASDNHQGPLYLFQILSRKGKRHQRLLRQIWIVNLRDEADYLRDCLQLKT